MSVTILGQNIRLIRPERINRPKVYKNEKPTIKYNKRSKTIKERSGKVVAVCITTITGRIFELTAGIHSTVCIHYGVDPNEVIKSGWKLENGNYVWR